MTVKQGQLADRHGNINVSPAVSKTISIPDESDSGDLYWEWPSAGVLEFNIKMQAAGVLKVLLIGEDEGDEKLMPFHEGWNAERVWRVYADASNDTTGLVIAGR